MNDYGLFNGIRTQVLENSAIQQANCAVYTHLPDDANPPYILVDFYDFDADMPFMPERVRIGAKLKVVSQYHGIKELCEITHALKQRLENGTLKIPGAGLQGAAQARFRLKRYTSDLKPDGMSRTCEVDYDVKLTFEGAEE